MDRWFVQSGFLAFAPLYVHLNIVEYKVPYKEQSERWLDGHDKVFHHKKHIFPCWAVKFCEMLDLSFSTALNETIKSKHLRHTDAHLLKCLPLMRGSKDIWKGWKIVWVLTDLKLQAPKITSQRCALFDASLCSLQVYTSFLRPFQGLWRWYLSHPCLLWSSSSWWS